MNKMQSIRVRLDNVMSAHTPHPFTRAVSRGNARQIARRYLAMSLGFPYVQAGSQRALADEFMDRDQAPSEAVEVTSVVGNFLSWDETGGHGVVLEQGNAGLPRILDTRRNFHGRMLERDLERVLGEPVSPEFARTRPYLRALGELLASPDDVNRCAAMVSFERHAQLMISALWDRLRALFPSCDESLAYFEAHVGGDDPAEAYHVALTEQMIDRIVPAHEVDRFVTRFADLFAMHVAWARDICA